MIFRPDDRYVSLGPAGEARLLAGGPAFWALPEAAMSDLGSQWLISEYEFTADWPTWEMHPAADEFVYLLSGSIDLLLDEPAGVRTLPMREPGAVLVPRGIWHTAKIHAPSRMLHVTLGAGTETRAA